MIDILPDKKLITVSIPLDSDIVAQPPLRMELTLSTGLGFKLFHGLICNVMEIPQSHANLSY